MPLPKVIFQIVAEGADSAARAVKSLSQNMEQTTKSRLDRERVLIENAEIRKQRLAEDTSNRIKKIGDEGFTSIWHRIGRIMQAEQDAANKKIRLEEDVQRKIKRLREETTNNQINLDLKQFGASNKLLKGLSNIFPSFGGSGASGGGASAAGGEAMEGAAIGLAPETMGISLAIGAAIGGVTIAFKTAKEIIESGAKLAYEAFKFASTEIAGAMLELGQFRGVQESIVMSGRTETMATRNVFITPPGSRGGITPEQNIENVQKMSEGTIFNVQEVAKAQNEWLKYRGNLPEFNKHFKIFNELALVTGQSLDDTTRMFAQLRQEFQGLSDTDFDKLIMGLTGEARAGGVPINELGSLSPALGIAPALGGGVNAALLVGAVAEDVAPAFKRGGSQGKLGGGSGVSTAIKDIVLDVIKKPELAAALGAVVKNGVLLNPEAVFGNLAVATRHQEKSKLLSKPELELGETLRSRVEDEKGKNVSDKELGESVKDNVDAMRKNAFTVSELDNAYKKLMGTLENQLKTKFVELSNIIGQKVTPWIKDHLIPVIDKLTKWIKDNTGTFKNLYEQVKKIAESLWDMIKRITKPFFDLIMSVATFFLKNVISPMIDGVAIFLQAIGHILKKSHMPGLVALGKDLTDIGQGIAKGKKDITDLIEGRGKAGPKELETTAPKEKEIIKAEVTPESADRIGKAINDHSNIHNPYRRHWQPISPSRTN